MPHDCPKKIGITERNDYLCGETIEFYSESFFVRVRSGPFVADLSILEIDLIIDSFVRSAVFAADAARIFSDSRHFTTPAEKQIGFHPFRIAAAVPGLSTATDCGSGSFQNSS